VVETCPALERPSGCFVTLYGPGGRLRGCIGFIEAVKPLWEVVQQAAVGAALRDTRFAPVSERELPDIRLDVSLLSPAEPMEPEQVVPGRHGLIVEADGRRGLLLPQVASERGWDRETFLSQTCVKAGLPPDRWKRPGLLLSAFTAEVFGEPGAGQ
jgi:AmmeMemoRadiSam system protein A